MAFTGRCLVHRAELMELRGAWAEALDEARRAGERALAARQPRRRRRGLYRQGELHRLRGDAAAAEAAFRTASGYGREPQPGLACLRLQQGRPDLADAAIRRVLAATPERGLRAEVLPAAVDILLAVGDVAAARDAARRARRARRRGRGAAGSARWRRTRAARSRWPAAMPATRSSRCARPSASGRSWRRRTRRHASRVLAGLACRALGDEDSAALELDAARAAFAAARRAAGPRPARRRTGTADAAAAARAEPRGRPRCCAGSPRAPRTRRSPPSSC